MTNNVFTPPFDALGHGGAKKTISRQVSTMVCGCDIETMKNLILLLVMCLILTGCTTRADRQFSAIVTNAVEVADRAIANAVVEGQKANEGQISYITLAQEGFVEYGEYYQKQSGADSPGPFKDIADALGALCIYLKTGDQKAYNKFVSTYGPAKAQILNYADVLKKGL